MSPEQLKSILSELAAGHTTVAEALHKLQRFPVDTVADRGEVVARLDTMREARHGFPEVILAQGKQFDHLAQVVERSLEHGRNLLITRVAAKPARKLLKRFPDLQRAERASCLYREVQDSPEEGLVAILSAGTSDIAVAEEAMLTARLMGAKVQTYYDSGVAGLHRLLGAKELLHSARVFVVVAGMEGALPSVIGGLVDRPVIAVPTSQGYGSSFGGLSALLGMLNSCSANVTVVNIDNGFGAGYVAALINRLGGKRG